MKNLKIFGDSIIKGVTYNGQSYHLCQEHDFDTLRAQGVSDAALDKVCCPIGLGIGADTPQQIAVSVVAELMAARAGTLEALRAAR